MVTRCVLIGFLLVLAAGLEPLAEASPPDQTWLGGLYDDGDYDNIVVRITSAVSTVESQTVHETGPFQTLVEWVIPPDGGRLSFPRSRPTSRAPPTP